MVVAELVLVSLEQRAGLKTEINKISHCKLFAHSMSSTQYYQTLLLSHHNATLTYCSSLLCLCLLCVNRNLQAAIGAYYDFESPNVNTPSMSFVEDVTIGEGESVPPDTQFTKTWRIQNTGVEHVRAYLHFYTSGMSE